MENYFILLCGFLIIIIIILLISVNSLRKKLNSALIGKDTLRLFYKEKLQAIEEANKPVESTDKTTNIMPPKKVVQYDLKDNPINNFSSLRQACLRTNITRYAIKKSCESSPNKIINNTYFKYAQ